ncbi:MAG: class I SAM-dependent methyltransferase [Patescibacteria group bacterium]
MNHPLLDQLRYEQVRCPLCGAAEATPLVDFAAAKSGLRIPMRSVVCNACGLAYANNRPNARAYNEFYEDFYKWEYGKERIEVRAADRDEGAGADLKTKRVVDFLKGSLSRVPRAVDLGCSMGKLLVQIKKEYPEASVLGVELDRLTAQRARDSGIPINEESIDAYLDAAPPRGADLIIMRHVLEHLLEPLPTLAKIKRHCDDNGFLYIEVPNVLTFTRTLSHFFMPGHVMHFCPETLSLLLLRSGFRVVRIGSLEHGVLCVLATPVENGNGYYPFSSIDFGSAARRTHRHVRFMKRYGGIVTRFSRRLARLSALLKKR